VGRLVVTTVRILVSQTTPVPLLPSGQSGAITLYNDGDNECSVGQDPNGAYYVPLEAKHSIRWDAGTPLYAQVSDPAASTHVLVIDSAVILPTGTVEVSGPLQISDIVSPVLIQGGGELLYDAVVSLPGGGLGTTTTIPIPAASSGLIYPSLYVSLLIMSSPTPSYGTWAGYYVDGPAGGNPSGTLVYEEFQLETHTTAFSVPWLTAESPTIEMQSNNACDMRIVVWAASSQLTEPVTDLGYNFLDGVVLFGTGSGPTTSVYVPGAFQEYYIVIVAEDDIDSDVIVACDKDKIIIPEGALAGSRFSIVHTSRSASELTISDASASLRVFPTRVMPPFLEELFAPDVPRTSQDGYSSSTALQSGEANRVTVENSAFTLGAGKWLYSATGFMDWAVGTASPRIFVRIYAGSSAITEVQSYNAQAVGSTPFNVSRNFTLTGDTVVQVKAYYTTSTGGGVLLKNVQSSAIPIT
jgi:hypothetical protein